MEQEGWKNWIKDVTGRKNFPLSWDGDLWTQLVHLCTVSNTHASWNKQIFCFLWNGNYSLEFQEWFWCLFWRHKMCMHHHIFYFVHVIAFVNAFFFCWIFSIKLDLPEFRAEALASSDEGLWPISVVQVSGLKWKCTQLDNKEMNFKCRAPSRLLLLSFRGNILSHKFQLSLIGWVTDHSL